MKSGMAFGHVAFYFKASFQTRLKQKEPREIHGTHHVKWCHQRDIF